jgi:hypothetical protein
MIAKPDLKIVNDPQSAWDDEEIFWMHQNKYSYVLTSISKLLLLMCWCYCMNVYAFV